MYIPTSCKIHISTKCSIRDIIGVECISHDSYVSLARIETSLEVLFILSDISLIF